jgi:hypothetical protein
LGRRVSWRVDWAVAAIYALAAAAYAWPLLCRFGTALAGNGYDAYVFQWANWWVVRALGQGQSPYHTTMIFFPRGAALYFLSFSWLNTFVWWPLQAAVGNAAAYNFTVWWSWPLAGFGTYLLAREVTGDRRAAFVAGLVYAFYPYHFAQRNHINLLSVQWLPFSLLFLMRAVRRGRMRDGALTGFFFACAGLAGWHLLTLGGMLGGLWFLYAWITERNEWHRRNWRALVVMVGILAVLVGPLLAPIAWEQFANPEGQDPYLGKEGETQSDLASYIIPNLYHPLWGHLAAPVHGRFLRNKDHAVALGYLPLALVGFGLLRWRAYKRLNRFWFLGLLVFFLLALGPFPRINGVAYPQIPLPYRLVGWTLPVQSLRNPERFNIVVGLCLAMVVSVTTSDIVRRLSVRRAAAVAVALSGLVLLEYWAWPFPTTSPDIPDFYHQLTADPGDFAIVDVPMTNDLSKRYMYYQTVHGKPTVTGHVSRPPEGAYDFITSVPLLNALWNTRRPPPEGRLSTDVEELAGVGIRYIVVHRDLMGNDEWEAWTRYADVAPVFIDEDLYVYNTKGAQ